MAGSKQSIKLVSFMGLIHALSSLEWFVSKGVQVDTMTSEHVKDYLKAGNPHPAILFPNFFSDEFPTVAITYQWVLTLVDVGSYLSKGQIAKSRGAANVPQDTSRFTIWVDVFFIDQNSQDIDGNLEQAQDVYRNAEFHFLLLSSQIFTRAWCLYEIAVRRQEKKDTIILESANPVHSRGLQVKTISWHPAFSGSNLKIWFRGGECC